VQLGTNKYYASVYLREVVNLQKPLPVPEAPTHQVEDVLDERDEPRALQHLRPIEILR
jgi:hypothetical protein